ncbi:ferric-dicitrate binding protein FerR (iron transport regulator) [Dyadobacter jejuensis]|uniref:Ferric-dicitrate binding protein FerR (Iron transport regulator) n=1 Tax=Dyadobacter jejuensis TaxID=1082580 RepID=A0A316AZ89_9BACT|nr:FecR domain-containing protein [Dyadobacter jejuensis]PWJ55547.1 ferric-dicitrate binding protein FerR (iron transport regulator) [Dyadobacter jejuensis]
MREEKLTPELLKRFLEGQATEEERLLVETWYQETNFTESEGTPFNQEAHLLRIREKINTTTGEFLDLDSSPMPVRLWRQAQRYVAVALILLIGGLGLYYVSELSQPTTSSIASLVIKNSEKKVAKHTLPDGTSIWLNPEASLSYYPESFMGDHRNVTLEGEAFFDVSKDASRPFIINSKEIVIKVLGTSFNVRAISGQENYAVSVVSGKVEVASVKEADKNVTLLAEEEAVFEVATGSLLTSRIPDKNQPNAPWQPVSLAFEDTPLKDVAQQLEKRFGITVQLAHEGLNKCLVTANFDQNRLSEVLETITQMLGATYEINASVVTISGEGCTNPGPGTHQ